jgi:transposase
MSKNKDQFTEEFKKQMVAMYNSGKSATEIAKEYGMAKSTLHKWINNFNKNGSLKDSINTEINYKIAQ